MIKAIKMKDLYNYPSVVLRGMCLNCLHTKDMDATEVYGSITDYVNMNKYCDFQTTENILNQMVEDELLVFNGEKYHITEKGKEIRNKFVLDYFDCGNAIAKSFGFGLNENKTWFV